MRTMWFCIGPAATCGHVHSWYLKGNKFQSRLSATLQATHSRPPVARGSLWDGEWNSLSLVVAQSSPTRSLPESGDTGFYPCPQNPFCGEWTVTLGAFPHVDPGASRFLKGVWPQGQRRPKLVDGNWLSAFICGRDADSARQPSPTHACAHVTPTTHVRVNVHTTPGARAHTPHTPGWSSPVTGQG